MMSRQLVIVIVLFVALSLGIVLVWPRYQELSSFRVQIKQKETELQEKKSSLLALQNISEELKKYSEELSKIDSALPSELSLPSLFQFLQKASSQNGLILREISQVATSSLKERPDVKEHSLKVSLAGSYSSLKNFLFALEKTVRLIEVESVSFSSPKLKEGETETIEVTPFSFNLQIKFHSY